MRVLIDREGKERGRDVYAFLSGSDATGQAELGEEITASYRSEGKSETEEVSGRREAGGGRRQRQSNGDRKRKGGRGQEKKPGLDNDEEEDEWNGMECNAKLCFSFAFLSLSLSLSAVCVGVLLSIIVFFFFLFDETKRNEKKKAHVSQPLSLSWMACEGRSWSSWASSTEPSCSWQTWHDKSRSAA